MAHVKVPDQIERRYVPRSGLGNGLFWAMFAVGLVAFVLRLRAAPQDAWISYVSNWMFFTSIAMGAVILAVVTHIAKAKWNWSIRRIAVAFAAYLPVAFVLFLPMLGLRENYFPWIEEMAHDPILQNKQAWLNVPFLVVRNLVAVLVLFGLSLYFAYLSLRPDLAPDTSPDARSESWRARLAAGWLGQEEEEVRSYRRMLGLGPALVLVYAAVMSLLSFDWIMSLEPHWFSTLFGGWFFMGAFWGGIAATALALVWLHGQDRGVAEMMGLQQRHDLGKLAFAFTVFWGYLAFAQYLVIWYGKLPWEQAWIVHRTGIPWGPYSAAVVALCFVIPFAGLIGRAPKLNPKTLGLFTAVILVGLWLERFMLIAPSLHHEGDPTLTIWHPLISLLFLGPFLMALRWTWATFPVVQRWQPPQDDEMLEAEVAPRSASEAAD